MHLGLATMVGNESGEQWGANTGDAQQLQEQTETGGLHSLLRLLPEWASVDGTWAQMRGRQGWRRHGQ